MNTLESFFYEMSKVVKGWTKTTLGIVIGILTAVAFYFFAKLLRSNKSEGKATVSMSALFVVLLCVGAICLITACLNY